MLDSSALDTCLYQAKAKYGSENGAERAIRGLEDLKSTAYGVLDEHFEGFICRYERLIMTVDEEVTGE